jgi:hypothetical protein
MENDQPALRALFAANLAFQNRKSGWNTPHAFAAFVIWQMK